MKGFIKLLPAIIWFGIILYLLTLPGADLPKIGWVDTLQVDKLIHIFLFCTLVFLWYWGIVSSKQGSASKSVLLFLAIAALVYGIAMEFVQKYWIPNRSFDVWDILADGIGSFLPLIFQGKTNKIIAKSLPGQADDKNPG